MSKDRAVVWVPPGGAAWAKARGRDGAVRPDSHPPSVRLPLSHQCGGHCSPLSPPSAASECP